MAKGVGLIHVKINKQAKIGGPDFAIRMADIRRMKRMFSVKSWMGLVFTNNFADYIIRENDNIY